ncbi:hypothetical protein [Streptomyces sp. NPDC046759]|uniref:hypothetical protein n=1 Tax=Streptomyces sp. NPDC046759 TaxID=3155019 RepID=UPI0033E2DFC2
MATTIRRKGGCTKTIRPPEAITRKDEAANAAHDYKGSFKDSVYDHHLSLHGDEAAHGRLLREGLPCRCRLGIN